MSYCINPNCSKPQNTGKHLFCLACGSELLLQGCYRVTRLLSNPNTPSGFGTIYELDDNGNLKILKVLHNTHPKAVELFQQEARVLSQLHHPGIPRVESDGYFVFFPRHSQESLHCLVMEKIEGMNLEEYITQRNHEPIRERAAVRWLKQIVEILHQVHQQQYFHRDIKPPNIMLRPDGQLALIDFGTAREVTQTFMQKVAGQQVTGIISAGYTPPEQMNGKAVPQSDFFALGRTFVYLLTGKHPHDFPEDSRTGQLMWRDSATSISKGLGDFIDYLMAPFPGNRPRDTLEILQIISVIERSLSSSGPFSGNNQSSGSQESKQQKPTLVYAEFWRRALAYLIDTVICHLAGGCIGGVIGVIAGYFLWKLDLIYPGSSSGAAYSASASFTYLLGFGAVGGLFIFSWYYFTFAESSAKQGTVGKRFLGIVVTDLSGNCIGFGRANSRYWSRIVVTLFLSIYGILIDCIFALFTKKKQTLHDMIAKTLVVKKRSL